MCCLSVKRLIIIGFNCSIFIVILICKEEKKKLKGRNVIE